MANLAPSYDVSSKSQGISCRQERLSFVECTERLTTDQIVRFVSIGKRHRVWRWTKPLEGDRGRLSKRDREWYEMVD